MPNSFLQTMASVGIADKKQIYQRIDSIHRWLTTFNISSEGPASESFGNFLRII